MKASSRLVSGVLLVVGSATLLECTWGQDIASDTTAQLRAEVELRGETRVVVTLAIPGAQPPSAEAISAAQDRLVSALAGSHYASLWRFRNLPQLALTVRRDALEVLIGSPLVASLSMDAMAEPMLEKSPR